MSDLKLETERGFSELPPRIKWDGQALQVAGSITFDEVDRVMRMLHEFRNVLKPKKGIITFNVEAPHL